MKTLSEFVLSSLQKNPNLFGETIRNAVFVEEVGGYNCFNLIPEFYSVDPKDSLLGHRMMLLLEPDDMAEAVLIYSNGNIHVGWFWDGDGTLLVVSENDKLAALNTDCKKDYNWKFVKWS